MSVTTGDTRGGRIAAECNGMARGRARAGVAA
jgi:hypothetical protein